MSAGGIVVDWPDWAHLAEFDNLRQATRDIIASDCVSKRTLTHILYHNPQKSVTLFKQVLDCFYVHRQSPLWQKKPRQQKQIFFNAVYLCQRYDR